MNYLLISFALYLNFCFGIKLNPLENNDKLQHLSNQYVAEWQWESWPIKQESSELDSKSPGARTNVALWKDSSGPNWYLFGGQPVNNEFNKIYSDVWKYSVTTRVWERFFPSQTEVKGPNSVKIGGVMTLRASLFNEGHVLNSGFQNEKIILCGGVAKGNATKTKLQKSWSNFSRRKKQEKEQRELRSLAIYAPKTSKSNTVWQIDLKDKLWTAYVCCCDVSNNDYRNETAQNTKATMIVKNPSNESAIEKAKPLGRVNQNKTDSLDLPVKINKRESGADNDQLSDSNEDLKNKKKTVNQSKIVLENANEKSKEDESKSEIEQEVNETIRAAIKNESIIDRSSKAANQIKMNFKMKKEKYNLKLHDMNKTNKTENSQKNENIPKVIKPKMASKYCPEFLEGREPVTWCDGNNEVLITVDVSSPKINLWIFNLTTSHWSQKLVKIPSEIKWPGCSNAEPYRYAGNEEEVFIVCSPFKKKSKGVIKYSNESTNQSKKPSEEELYTTKLVYRINYTSRVLEYLGKIHLNSFLSSPKGQNIWKNEARCSLQIVRTPQNQTILVVAYLDSVSLWILIKDQNGRPYFDVVEKVWRGSAIKWFNKYNAALYNFQFTSESGNSETILMPNPRIIEINEYWPRDRGRFIIRIYKNENLKNGSFENRTREKNLTYELLQSDYKSPSREAQFYSYILKVLIFFGVSLSVFTVFGVAIFLIKCVTCPPKFRPRNECHKSPVVIRYSVIPDDLLFPVA